MAKEEIAYKVSVEVEGGAKSLSELKREFKEAQKSLEGLQQGTEEYIAALGRLGDARDGVADLNEEINALAGLGGNIQAVGNVVQGLAGGFAAAQGAMALFGGENEDLQKTLVKLQAVMAIQQGLAGLEGLGQSFKALTGVLKTTAIGTKLVTAAQWLWNTAVMANPIGLLVAGVAALTGAIYLLVSAQNDEAEVEKRLQELRAESIKQREKDIELIRIKQAALQSTSDFELELAKTLGKSSKELYEKEHANILKRIEDIELLKWYRVNGELTADELNELNELNRKKTLLEIKYSTETINTAKKTRDELAKIKADKDKKDKEDEEKRVASAKKAQEDYADRINAEADAYDAKIARKKKADEDEWAEAIALADEMRKEDDRILKIDEAKKKIKTDEELQAYKDKMAQRIQLESDAINSIQALSDIAFAIRLKNVKKGSAEEEKVARQSFKVNKALQLSTAVINGVQAIQSILAQYPKFDGGIAMAGALIATGTASIANIAKIAATQFGATGGGGGSTPGTIEAPRINTPTQGSTQLNANGTVKQQGNNSQVFKAIVVETDITKTQKRVKTLETNSKF